MCLNCAFDLCNYFIFLKGCLFDVSFTFVGAWESQETGMSGRVREPSGGASLRAKRPYCSYGPAAYTEPA